jgi:hypothetical protein
MMAINAAKKYGLDATGNRDYFNKTLLTIQESPLMN